MGASGHLNLKAPICGKKWEKFPTFLYFFIFYLEYEFENAQNLICKTPITASFTIPPDILETPSSRSENKMGISFILKPRR